MGLSKAQRTLRNLGDPKKAQDMQRFFKTGAGEYGEGDVFLGISVPEVRKTAIAYSDTSDKQLNTLLSSCFHEERLLALLILVRKYEQGSNEEKQTTYRQYLQSTKSINNWDLVDLSAHKIVGAHLVERSRKPLYKLACSKNLWERRIAIISTFQFIRQGDFADALNIAELLLEDTHDLIHKAVGWMIREVGNRNLETMEKFLRTRYKSMPRTMLRYAIEKLPEKRRQCYLKGTLK